MQEFYRTMAGSVRPSPVPVRDVTMPDIAASDLTGRDMQDIEQLLPSLFFLEPAQDGRYTITAPLFVLPNGEQIELRGRWMSLLNTGGRNIQRAPDAEEKRSDEGRSERRTGGEYSAAVYGERGQVAVNASGIVEASIPLRLFRVELDCARPGRFKAGPRTVTLIRCENDFVELREAGGLLEEAPDIRVYGAAGRLQVAEQAADPVFAGGKSILDFQFKNRPVRIEGRRFRLLVYGTARRIIVNFPAQMARKSFNVRASAPPAGMEAGSNRFLRPVNLETGTYRIDRAAVRGKTPRAESVRGSKEEMELILPLADHPGARFADCRLDSSQLEGMRLQPGAPQASEGACRVRVRRISGAGGERLRGTWKVRYPLTYAASLAGPGDSAGVSVRLQGGKVVLQAPADLPEPEHIAGLAAFRGRLFPLQPLRIVSRIPAEKHFWGRVEKIWFARLTDWIEYEAAFDLPAPEESAGQ